MAHLTNSAVDGVLDYLSKAVKNEAKLLKRVEGDIQFIKDELDSMNGFLMYLTKKKASTHDDQVRAWMKQVRDLAYVADDCIKLYRRDLAPPETGFWPWLRHIPTWLNTVPTRHRLAKKIHKLKERVREVGERRVRYDVKLPESKEGDETSSTLSMVPVPRRDGKIDDEKCEALERGLREVEQRCQVKDDHVKLADLKAFKTLKQELKTDVLTIMEMVMMRKDAVSAKMLLRAVYADPYGITKLELEELLNKLKEISAELHDDVILSHHVMVLCYSKLSTHHKSCLQYLTTFGEEKSISRTCLVRRWLAEGLVAKDQQQQGVRPGDGGGDDDSSMEEAGERCFNELVLRGYIRPAPPLPPAGLKIKSCIVDPSVKTFISNISKSDNFIDDLPTHLQHQIDIRKLSQKPQPPQHKPWWWCPLPTCIICCHDDDGGKPLPPMDEMVKLLKSLPEEYRLNVLDLGGCTGLTMRHLTSICELVPSLKYLSLRKTNVFWLPSQMNNLLHLETLDIRDTRAQANALRNIFLHELRHLLAGYVSQVTADAAQLSTVKIPKKLGKNTEILKHVQIIDDGRHAQAQLRRVGSLKRLRKLGIVLSGSQQNMAHLLTAISMRSESLRSLSVWITMPPLARDGGFVTVDTTIGGGGGGGGVATFFTPPEKLETLNLKCFKGNSTRGRIPQWIEGLQFLSKITLRHSLLTQEGLSELGKLEMLRCLKLCCESYIEDKVTLKEEEFKELRFLLLDHVSNNTKKLEFKRDAAPKMRNIVWNLDSNMAAGITVEADDISSTKNKWELKINGDIYPHSKLLVPVE